MLSITTLACLFLFTKFLPASIEPNTSVLAVTGNAVIATVESERERLRMRVRIPKR